MPNQIPLDPKLRKDFDNTRNEARSKAELDAWWDHPYGISLPDGRIEVRCLNGGAWDRSTHLGIASSYAEACAIAEVKQAAWVRYRGRPVYYTDEKPTLMLMPQRPDRQMERIIEVSGPEEAAAYLQEHYPETGTEAQ